MSRLYDTMVDLAACLCAQVAVDNPEDPNFCFCGVIPGRAVLPDYIFGCDDGGMGWVRLGTTYPSESPGQIDRSFGNCGTGLGFELEIGILRRAIIEEEAPTMEESAGMVERQIADVQTLSKAISCCPSLGRKDYILGQYQPVGPDGGVVGGAFTIYVSLV